jgi:ribosomal protein S18 acetylase RimI-like enzyme
MYSGPSLEKQMKEGAQFVIVYEHEMPVGFASFQEIRPALYKLHKLYVLPSQQGKGTGRLLIDFICTISKENGASAIQLQVNRNNKAKDFYTKNGFVVVEAAAFDIGNGYVMDDYIMQRNF